MTIDEILVYIPQLTRRKQKLENMSNTLEKIREQVNMRSNIIDYRYVNYDIDDAKKEYDAISEELNKAQISLDKTNITKKFDIEM